MWFQRNFLPFYRVNFGFPVGSNSRSLSIFVFSPGIKVFATLCVCVCMRVCVLMHMVTSYVSGSPFYPTHMGRCVSFSRVSQINTVGIRDLPHGDCCLIEIVVP